MESLDRAADALRDGDLVVYPTETVYGLGANALDPDAVARVFDAKGRDHSKPISLAAPSVEVATAWVSPSERGRALMDEFLPGPVTVICERRPVVPDVLTAGRDRVGVRVPAHDLALDLLDRVAPITATSANASGRPSVRRIEDLEPDLRDAVTAVVDGGVCPGTESTVVDPDRGVIHRRGALADEIAAWLDRRA